MPSVVQKTDAAVLGDALTGIFSAGRDGAVNPRAISDGDATVICAFPSVESVIQLLPPLTAHAEPSIVQTSPKWPMLTCAPRRRNRHLVCMLRLAAKSTGRRCDASRCLLLQGRQQPSRP